MALILRPPQRTRAALERDARYSEQRREAAGKNAMAEAARREE